MSLAPAETLKDSLVLSNLMPSCAAAVAAAERLDAAAREAVAVKVVVEGRVNPALLEQEQFATHGYAWFATYVASLREMLRWAERLQARGAFGELEALMLQSAFGEYLGQLTGGIALSQVEILRPADLGVSDEQVAAVRTQEVKRLIEGGNGNPVRMRIAELLAEGQFGERDLDETNAMIAEQFGKIADDYQEAAHEWHLKDELIPTEVIEQLAELGVFGLTVPEEWGGLGMGKTAMCVVTEEQKRAWLPKIASGEILPTAVFTEPNTGSDLGSLRTRAVKDGDVYRVTGNKTWITHAARSDVMTLLARTNPEEAGYKGLSMFLAEKPRGTDDHPFPAEGMTGGEIEVLGYRGMKEYELAFDNFEVKADNLLGGIEGEGFKQLMATFESARIQTAARAVGVAQNALELGLRYAEERKQFGKALIAFPRVAGKLAWMAVETMIARQLTYFSAREKDSERRCDIEAGMAKLLAARVAWANADNALQIHGGNGYALEYKISRVLCDARILNIFEGAAEIQAQVIARGLLTPGRN